MTHHSPTPYSTETCNNYFTRLYRPSLCNYKALYQMLNKYLPCKKAVVYNTIWRLIFIFLLWHLWGNIRVGNASHARWLGLNFMLLCSSFLDVTLLLQQSLLAVFYDSPNLLPLATSLDKCGKGVILPQPRRTPLRWEWTECLWWLFSSTKVSQYNFVQTQNRIF